MHNPAHPGEVLRETCIKPMGLTVKATAEGLGVTRKTLSDLLNCHNGVSPEMALRLELAGWSNAESWLKMQLNWNLWQARQNTKHLNVRRFGTSPAE